MIMSNAKKFFVLIFTAALIVGFFFCPMGQIMTKTTDGTYRISGYYTCYDQAQVSVMSEDQLKEHMNDVAVNMDASKFRGRAFVYARMMRQYGSDNTKKTFSYVIGISSLIMVFAYAVLFVMTLLSLILPKIKGFVIVESVGLASTVATLIGLGGYFINQYSKSGKFGALNPCYWGVVILAIVAIALAYVVFRKKKEK